MKVLVTGAGALLGQGILRSLRRSQLRPCVVACDPSPLAAGLYWADTAYLIPMAGDPAYIGRLRELIHKEKPDAVLVGTDVELPILAQARSELEVEFGTRVIVSSPEVVAIADDKWLTFLFLRGHGFPHPCSALPADATELVEQVGFPLIVKPRRGARSVGVSLVRSLEELNRVLAAGSDLVVQECVGGPEEEYTSGLICFDGSCQACITMRRILRDGNTYRAFPMPDFPHDGTLRCIAGVLKPYGPVNFQFRLVGGQIKIFEINARFSGTTPLRELVGFPEVDMVLRYVLLADPVRQPVVKTDVVLRHWSETVVPTKRLLKLKHE